MKRAPYHSLTIEKNFLIIEISETKETKEIKNDKHKDRWIDGTAGRRTKGTAEAQDKIETSKFLGSFDVLNEIQA